MNWWQRLWHRSRMERELDSELRFHLEHLEKDYIRAGMSEEHARRAARLDLGGIEQLKEECRDARGTRWVHDFAQDLRFSARLLLKERGLTITAVIALALGIGVNNTLFSIVNALCIRGLPIESPDRAVFLSARDSTDRSQSLTLTEFESLRTGLRSVSEVAGFASAPVALGDDGLAPERVVDAYISANANALIGQQPIVGRDFRPEDDRPGAASVIILGARVWKGRYGSDPSVIGRSVRVSRAPATVIGVMPEGFKFPNNADVWQPLAAAPAARAQEKNARVLGVFARLKDGETLAQARGEVGAIGSTIAELTPDTSKGIRLTVVPINERYNGDITNPAWIAFITVGALLVIIACSNVANLLLSRSVRRSREIAIRLALGATRTRIIRQLLAESLILAAVGGITGLALSAVGLRLFDSAIPENGHPFWVTLTMDGRVLTMLAAVCLGTVVLFGLAPAMHPLPGPA